MPLPLTISCSSKSRLVLTFLVLPFWCLLTRVDPDIFQMSSKTVVCVHCEIGDALVTFISVDRSSCTSDIFLHPHSRTKASLHYCAVGNPPCALTIYKSSQSPEERGNIFSVTTARLWTRAPAAAKTSSSVSVRTNAPAAECWFLADRTIGRAIGTVSRLTVVCLSSVCRL